MADKPLNSISPKNPAYGISLNTPWPVKITSTEFEKFIGGTSSDALDKDVFDSVQMFTSIKVVDGATDTVDVNIELVNRKGIYSRVIPMRVGSFMPCRGRRILTSSSDPSIVLVVGVGV